jgi:hypothetical protein
MQARKLPAGFGFPERRMIPLKQGNIRGVGRALPSCVLQSEGYHKTETSRLVESFPRRLCGRE